MLITALSVLKRLPCISILIIIVNVIETILSFSLFCPISGPHSRVKENDNNLPSYNGFECDVFRAIQDHYDSTLKEPLMTYNMFKLFDMSTGMCWVSGMH